MTEGALQVGTFVRVPGRGLGTVELDNEDGTWSVGFEDGSEADVPNEDIVVPVAVEGGARLVRDPTKEAKPEGWTRFVCFSDTHGLHGQIPKAHFVKADVLLHAGDFSNTGELDQVQSFAQWLKDYPAAHKVVIAGNHDVTFEPEYYARKWHRYHAEQFDCTAVREALISSGACVYLEDAAVEIEGYTVYGSPWQPAFCDWAFNLPHGEECRRAWAKIPAQVDVLLAHGPPLNRGDLCAGGNHAGCPELLRAVAERAVPVSLAGHIHEGYGAVVDGVTLFLNASTCTLQYRPLNAPLVFDLPPPSQLRAATRAAAVALSAAPGALKPTPAELVGGVTPPA